MLEAMPCESANPAFAGMHPAQGTLVLRGAGGHAPRMDLDSLLHSTFGTTDIDTLDPIAFEAGLERATTAFGVETDQGRRFALWVLLHALGHAPDPEVGFKDPATRRAAQDYARAAGRMSE